MPELQEFRSALTPFRNWLFKSHLLHGGSAAQERFPREKCKVSSQCRQMAAPELLELLLLLFFAFFALFCG